ncbi:MAG: hypothetical protein IPL41_10025 [Micropruina sp.]|nr:hypothetical protein [Micropruina sp.]
MKPPPAGPVVHRLVIVGLAIAALIFIVFGVQEALQHGRAWWPSVVIPLATGAVAGLIVWLNRRRVTGTGPNRALLVGLPSAGLVLIGLALFLIYGH